MKIGILGGGQLALMLAQARFTPVQEFQFFSPDPNPCAAPQGQCLQAPFSDRVAQKMFFEWADVVTLESENIPYTLAEQAELRSALYPSAQVLLDSSDRLLEKRVFQELGIATANHAPVNSLAELEAAVATIGLPAILKTRHQGYDGKGQFKLESTQQLATAWESCGSHPCILEAVVNFDREISIIAVRNRTGDTAFYPLAQNWHRQGVLRLSLATHNDPMQMQAEAIARQILEKYQYVGVFTLELFQKGNQLIANEMAPRVHNSGHWSIEASSCSQFENHLRAICGFPLGDTSVVSRAAMVNLIGSVPNLDTLLGLEWLHPHWYGKKVLPGRKVGHLTLLDNHLCKNESAESDFNTKLLQLLEWVGEHDVARSFQEFTDRAQRL